MDQDIGLKVLLCVARCQEGLDKPSLSVQEGLPVIPMHLYDYIAARAVTTQIGTPQLHIAEEIRDKKQYTLLYAQTTPPC